MDSENFKSAKSFEDIDKLIETETKKEIPATLHKKPRTDKSMLLWILVLVVTFVIAVVLVGYLYLQNQSLREELNKPVPTVTTTPEPTQIVDPTLDWETYENENHEISFKYPNTWEIEVKEDKNWPKGENTQVILTKGEATVTMYLDLVGIGGQGQDYEGVEIDVSGYKLYKYEFSNAQATKVIGITDDLTQSLGVFMINNKTYSITLMHPEEGDFTEQEKEYDLLLSTFKFSGSEIKPTIEEMP